MVARRASVLFVILLFLAVFTVPPQMIGNLPRAYGTISPSIQLSPTSATTGTVVIISGSGFDTADSYVTIEFTPNSTTSYGSWTPGLWTGTQTCSVSGGLIQNSPACTFTVSSTAADPHGSTYLGTYPYHYYTVTAYGNDNPTDVTDWASATFTVLPSLTLTATPNSGTPNSGPYRALVTLSGSGFLPSIQNKTGSSPLCGPAITQSPAGSAALETAASCQTDPNGVLSGQFSVSGSASVGLHVWGLSGIAAQAVTAQFTVFAPTLTLTPSTGTVGQTITASGSNYVGTGTCKLTPFPSSLFSTSSYSCSLTGGNLYGGFTVALGASGTYAVQENDTLGEVAIATFTVTGGNVPTFTLNPTSGFAGTLVTVSGSNYVGSTCNLVPSPSNFFATSACSVSSGTLGGSFVVASNASAGVYAVTVVVSNAPSDTMSATFTVIGSTLTLNPSSGSAGTTVAVSGSNYQGSTCSLSSTPSGLLSSAACNISSGTLSGSFKVASGASSGSYAVTVTTGVPADTRTVAFGVTASPAPVNFGLSPTSGAAGTIVTASGSNYQGTSCSLSSSPSGLVSSSSCSISGGTLTGGFVVPSGVSPGVYTVTVSTNISGESGSATFTVPSPTLTLNPVSGSDGTVVTVSGLNYAGTSCTLSANPSNLFASSSCNISGGSLSGGFTVASSAPAAGYTITVTTDVAGETKSASFNVIPSLPTCLIATATFGSVAAPAVQFLRDFRDRQILSTSSGSAFMVVFNAWYYSFSPSVAGYISTHALERTVMKGVLIPLIGILEFSSYTFSAVSGFPELAVLLSGLVASSLIGALYLGLPLSLIRAKVRRLRGPRGRNLERILTTMLLGGVAVLIFGELLSSSVLLMISSSVIVLSAMFLSAAYTSRRIAAKIQ